MIPEKKYKEHDKIVSYDVIAGRIIPKPICRPDCPACIEDARDKEWAEWILKHSVKDGLSIEGKTIPLVFIDDEDYEALKKLVEQNKEEEK
jgi:hypothetical protein